MSDRGDELSEFEDVASILRRGPSDVTEEMPPPALWRRIEEELAAAGDEMATPGVHDDRAEIEHGSQPVTSLDEHRARRKSLGAVVVGVAAAILLVALPLGLAWRSSTGGPDRIADLTALDAFAGMGSAELDGRELRVETSGLVTAEDSSYELWLLDFEGDELRDLVSLGLIEADGTYVIADDIDLDEFSVVDISVEPHDGNPEHSGNSVLRGDLQA